MAHSPAPNHPDDFLGTSSPGTFYEDVRRAIDAQRALDGTTTPSAPQPATANLGAEQESFLTHQEREAGQNWYALAANTPPTSPNGPSFLFGKFKPGWIENFRNDRDFQSVIVDSDGRYAEGKYLSSMGDFVLASSIYQTLGQVDRQVWGTNFLISYPSAKNPAITIFSYGMWQSAEFVGDRVKLPNDDFLSFNFGVPTQYAQRLRTVAHANPRVLEATLQASPYGQLMYTSGGPIGRMVSNGLIAVHFDTQPGNTQVRTRQFSHDFLTDLRAGNYPFSPMTPAIGDVPHRPSTL
jgi:hypothetical protein